MGYAFNNVPTQLELGGAKSFNYFTITTAASTVTLPDIQTTILTGMDANRVLYAFLDLYIPYFSNTNAGINFTDDTIQYLQVKRSGAGAGSWTNASNMGYICNIAASSGYHYGVIKGELDVSTQVKACFLNNQNLNVQWKDARSFVDSLIFNDVQPVLKLVIY